MGKINSLKLLHTMKAIPGIDLQACIALLVIKVSSADTKNQHIVIKLRTWFATTKLNTN